MANGRMETFGGYPVPILDQEKFTQNGKNTPRISYGGYDARLLPPLSTQQQDVRYNGHPFNAHPQLRGINLELSHPGELYRMQIGIDRQTMQPTSPGTIEQLIARKAYSPHHSLYGDRTEVVIETGAQHFLSQEIPHAADLVDMVKEKGLFPIMFIPTYKEKGRVGNTIEKLRGLEKAGLVKKMIVIDSHSPDGTPNEVREHGVQCIDDQEILGHFGFTNKEEEKLFNGKGANFFALCLILASAELREKYMPELAGVPLKNIPIAIFDADAGLTDGQGHAALAPAIAADVDFVRVAFPRYTREGIAEGPLKPGKRVTRLVADPSTRVHGQQIGNFFGQLNGAMVVNAEYAVNHAEIPNDYRLECRLNGDIVRRGLPVADVISGVFVQDGQTTQRLENMARLVEWELAHQRMKDQEQRGIDRQLLDPDGLFTDYTENIDLPNGVTIRMHPSGARIRTNPFTANEIHMDEEAATIHARARRDNLVLVDFMPAAEVVARYERRKETN